LDRSRRRVRKVRGTPRLVKVVTMLVMPLIVFFIAACDSGSQPARTPYQGSPEGKPSGLSAPIPDPKEISETKPAGQMPDFLASVTGPAHDRLMKLYQGAADHYDAYSHIPCYCGCAVYTTAHMSLAQCYISKMNSDGTMVFTDHSASCDICQGVAQDTLDGIAASTPLKDVRAAIFKKFSYTNIWTDTPAVP
jgi:Protein of unknown function with PCYCGC motif